MSTPRASWLRAFAARLRGSVRGPRHDDRFDDEMQEHLRLLVERFMAQGMSRHEAAAAARRQFGNTALLQDDRRALQTFPSADALWHDLRYALRTLLRSPGFSVVSIVTLGLGIGAAAAIYSVIHNVMLAPFPYQDAERIVFPRIYDPQRGPEIGRQGYAAAEVLEFVENNHVFDATTAALGESGILYRHRTGAQALSGAHVTPGTFEFFGMPAMHGRVLQPGDYEPGAPSVFVMSHKAWMERFGGDPSILNTALVLDGTPRTLVGIMPPRFGWYGSDVYFPARLTRGMPGSPYWFLVGRLKPGVSKQQAEANLTIIARRLATMKLHPQDYPKDFRIHIGSLGESVVGRIKPTLYTVLAAVALLLLIACSNVANLMLARATVREKEFALRTALGAGRARIVRLLIVESVILAMAGAALGILLASSGLKALVALMPPSAIPSEAVIALNAPVLTVTLGIAVLTALLCGLAPALQSFRRDLSDPLRDSGKGTSGGFRSRRLREAVVVLEVALSVTLLIGAGLLMRSFVALRDIRLGLEPDHVFTTVLTLPEERYTTAEHVRSFLEPLLDRVQALPGVVHAAASTAMPPFNTGGQSAIEIAGQAPDSTWRTVFQQVTAKYIPALRLELKAGRPFSEADVNDARRVAVVNETFVRKYLPKGDPLGQRVRLANLRHADSRLAARAEPVRDAWFEIVGVIGDVANRGPRDPTQPEVLIPSTVARSVVQVLIVRTSQDPAMLTNAVRREVSTADPDVPLIRPTALEDFISRQLYAGPRFGFLLMTVFGCVGLMLVTVGVYSVLAYSTTEKTHEIGIRMALGAKRTDVLGMIVRSGLRPVAAGLVIGLAMSTLLGRVLGTQLFGVTAYDPRTLAAAAMLLTTIAAIACWIPARRASRVDPLVALRHD
jgi:putative ABC transport system permease protein